MKEKRKRLNKTQILIKGSISKDTIRMKKIGITIEIRRTTSMNKGKITDKRKSMEDLDRQIVSTIKRADQKISKGK